MQIHRAYKYELDPNLTHLEYFRRACGIARFTYNWGLAEKKRQYEEAGTSDGFFTLKKRFVAAKDAEFPWVGEVSSWVYTYALKHLDEAYKRLFKGLGKHPRFKARGKCRDSFTVFGGACKYDTRRLKLPKLDWVRVKENLAKTGREPEGELLEVTISRDADRWYASIITRQEAGEPEPGVGAAVGIDLGLTAFATTSDGEKWQAPKPLQQAQQRVVKEQRKLSKKQKGSQNRKRQRTVLARAHRRARNQRRGWLHSLTTHLARNYSVVVLEDLNVKGMLRNHCLAKAISDASWHEFKRQLEYKMHWAGGELIVIDRWFPSSKTCSGCGYIRDTMPLQERVWDCPECGMHLDRDVNAAINILREGLAA